MRFAPLQAPSDSIVWQDHADNLYSFPVTVSHVWKLPEKTAFLSIFRSLGILLCWDMSL